MNAEQIIHHAAETGAPVALIIGSERCVGWVLTTEVPTDWGFTFIDYGEVCLPENGGDITWPELTAAEIIKPEDAEREHARGLPGHCPACGWHEMRVRQVWSYEGYRWAMVCPDCDYALD